MKNLWMSWSSGKDSALALIELQKNPEFEVTGLFTTISETYARVAMHATRLELLKRQSEQLVLPLELVLIPANCTNAIYEEKIMNLLAKAKANNVEAIGFGYLFLQDVQACRESQLAGSGIEPIFPLWNRGTRGMAKEIINVGIRCILTCIDPRRLSPSFEGRYFLKETLADFPPEVDPCGENGEFHSFVYSAPNFKNDIEVYVGEVVEREGFVFADVLPMISLP